MLRCLDGKATRQYVTDAAIPSKRSTVPDTIALHLNVKCHFQTTRTFTNSTSRRISAQWYEQEGGHLWVRVDVQFRRVGSDHLLNCHGLRLFLVNHLVYVIQSVFTQG